MNTKRFLLSSLTVWVYIFLFEFLLHGMFLEESYLGIKQMLRPDESMMNFFTLIVAGELVLAFGFCYIFIKGFENRGICEGIRYGLAVGLTFGVSSVLINHAVFTYPTSLSFYWALGFTIEMMLAGMLVSMIYKPKM